MRNEWYFVSCSHGLEKLLVNDLKVLNITELEEKKGGVQFKANPQQVIKLMLQTRVANRVMKSLTSFTVADAKDISAKALEWNWANTMDVKQSFKIKTLMDRESKAHFKNSLYLSQLLKDAIVDRFRTDTGKRPSVDVKAPELTFFLRVESSNRGRNFKATILLDLCGKPLNMRGYREITQVAPLREDLAAGMVLFTDWDPKTEIFVDPMCGSGTLIIEAAMIAQKIPPSYLRVRDYVLHEDVIYDFLRHKWFAPYKNDFKALAHETYQLCLELIKTVPKGKFFASDSSSSAINATKTNLAYLGFPLDSFSIMHADATRLRAPADPPGIIICNPPYGERMGEEEDLKPLYHEYGENLKHNFKGFKAYVFTSSAELRKSISLKTSQRIPLYNGDLECRLVKYDLF